MNTHGFELPKLPAGVGFLRISEGRINIWVDNYEAEQQLLSGSVSVITTAQAEEYALSAIEADRKRRGEPVGFLVDLNGREAYVSADRTAKDAHEVYGWTPVYAAPQPAEPVSGEVAAEAVDLLRAYRRLCRSLPRGDGYHLGRIESAIEALKSPQPAEPVTIPETVASDYSERGNGAYISKSDLLYILCELRDASLYRAAKIVSDALDSPQPAEPVTPRTQFEDALVQKVYSIICGDNHPPYGEHWDGYVSRLIVDALFPAEPVETDKLLRKFVDEAKRAGIDRLDLAHIYDEPERVPSDAEDDIVELLSEYADHNTEHGRMSFDKWTLREAVSALLARYTTTKEQT